MNGDHTADGSRPRRERRINAAVYLGIFTLVLAAWLPALRSGLIPVVNSMATTGLVFLPGMMTGQILAGAAPAEAIKYQLLVMFLIAGGTGLGVLATVHGGVLLLSDSRHRLRLDRLTAARSGPAHP